MDEFEFEGFDVPGTTPVPDVVFDKLLSRLTGNELKVLLYIIRRTYGFGKNADAISLSQFREGIKTRDENGDEKVLDEGCGIGHNRTILVALASLEQKGCVTSKKRNTNAGDSDTTIYKLRFKSANKRSSRGQSDNGVVTSGNHVVTPGNEGGYSTSPRWLPEVTTVVTSGNTQETVLQYTDKQETVLQRDTFGASIDSAALTPQEKIAKLEALIEELKKALPHQGNVQNDTPLTPAGNNTAAEGGSLPFIAQENTPSKQNGIPEPPASPTMPRAESQGVNVPPTPTQPSESPVHRQEMPSSTQAVNDTTNQATEQGKQQANGVNPIASGTTENPPAPPPKTSRGRGGKGAGKEEKPKKVKPVVPAEELTLRKEVHVWVNQRRGYSLQNRATTKQIIDENTACITLGHMLYVAQYEQNTEEGCIWDDLSFVWDYSVRNDKYWSQPNNKSRFGAHALLQMFAQTIVKRKPNNVTPMRPVNNPPIQQEPTAEKVAKIDAIQERLAKMQQPKQAVI